MEMALKMPRDLDGQWFLFIILIFVGKPGEILKKPWIVLTIIVLIALAIAPMCVFAVNQPLRVVLDDNYPPYAFRDAEGNLAGISIDLWDLFEARTGHEVEVTGMDWSAAQKKMQAGEFDVIDTMFKSAEREEIYDFMEPYAEITASLYFHSNISGIKDLASARGFSVAAKSGDFSMGALEMAGIDNVIFYEGYEDIVEEAEKGRVVMFIMDRPPAQYFLYKAGIQDQFNSTEALYANAIHRATLKGSGALLAFLEEGFGKITEEEMNEINEKWYGKGLSADDGVSRLTVYAGLGLLVLLGGVSVVNLTLRKRVDERTIELHDSLLENRLLTDRMKAIIDSIPDLMFILDRHGRFVDSMIGRNEKTLFEKETYIGKTIEEFFPANIANGFRTEFEEFLKSDITRVYEYDLREMGDETYYDLRFTRIDGVRVLGIVRNISDRKKAQMKLYELSVKDGLTGIYNRNHFEQCMALMNGKTGRFGIMVCDVDDLKLVNDVFGHVAGDDYLKIVSKVIEGVAPEGALAARIGGDEFAVILEETSLAEMEKMRQSITLGLKESSKEYPFTSTSLSMGYSVRQSEGESIQQLYKFADNEMYREKIRHRYSRKSGNISLLTNMLEARNFETVEHAKRLERHCVQLGRVLNLPESRINGIALLAEFHDIGKIGIRDSILLKEGKLTESELEEMKKHSEIGYRIAKSLPDIEHIAELIYKHHEWYNGGGYPFGLKGSDIPLECRILAVADAYDAMTSDRPYRKALGRAFAVEELKRFSGTQFDAYIVDKFLGIIPEIEETEKEAGS